MLKVVAFKASLLGGALAFVVVPLALLQLAERAAVRRHALLIALALLSVALPQAAAARFSAEFPSIVGGTCGLFGVAVLLAAPQTSFFAKYLGLNGSERFVRFFSENYFVVYFAFF